jgi:outer membrane protein assembly factor BamB
MRDGCSTGFEEIILMIYRMLMAFFFLTLSTAWAADWPQWRGPDRDNISTETGLLRTWPAGGPKVLWETSVAQGYAGVAIKNGLAYINDYDEDKKEHTVRCLSLDDGTEVWRWSYKVNIRPNHGITRTVPAVGDALVFSLDPKCKFHALDAKTGKLVWQKNLVQEYKTTIPQWYAGQNPLLDGDRVLVATGGDALVVAFDQATGNEVWKTPNPDNDLMSHASLMPATIGGVKQYLYLTMNKVVGVAAADGKLLWKSPFIGKLAVSPSPIYVGNGKVFVTAAYEVGSAMYQVQKTADGFSAKELFTLTSNQFNSEVHTPILYKDHLFAVSSKKRGQFTCLDLNGKIVWQSPVASGDPEGTRTFELGGFILADGMFYILDGVSGILRLVEANITGYKELASAQILEGHDVWGPPALSDGKLIIRDMGRMVCLQVGK